MYGWRARIGLVVPSNNTVVEPEFARMAPDGVSAHAARIRSHGLAPDAILDMVKNSMRAIEELHAGEMSVIAYACLATTLVKGVQWNAKFTREVEEVTAKPAITAAAATTDALRASGAHRVAVATPYPERINRLLSDFFESSGLEIVSLRSVAVADSLEVCRLSPSVAYRIARQADTEEAEAVCIVATDFPTIDVLDSLERDLGKPVVSTNQALMWRALGLAGVALAVDGFGALFTKAAPS